MAPIRIGFIGLSAKPSWAMKAHLPYLKDSAHYTITALCNSSEDSARAAISAHSLPESTKAYGSPADVAADADVDLVVCATRVDHHYATIKPALEAGKDCFVEWPLASNLSQATELRDLAKKNGCRVMIGLQTQKHPVVTQIKHFIDSGRLGAMVSCSVQATSPVGGTTLPEALDYLVDPTSGGSLFNIIGMHALDALLFAIGEMTTISCLQTIRFPTVGLMNQDGKVVRSVQRGVPDHISFIGTLASGAIVTEALGGSPFMDSPGLTWRINGNKAEIEATSAVSFALSEEYSLRIRDRDASEPEEVVPVDDAFANQAQLPYDSRYVGALYEAFAKGAQGGYPDWDWAVERHQLLATFKEASDKGTRLDVS